MKAASVAILFLALFCVANADFQCDPKVNYIENNCNDCTCNPQLGLVCSASKLITNCQNYHQLRHCVIGTTNKIDSCNTCWCVNNFGTVCTNKKC